MVSVILLLVDEEFVVCGRRGRAEGGEEKV